MNAPRRGVVAVLLVAASLAAAATRSVAEEAGAAFDRVLPFQPRDVRLLDGPFAVARERIREYVLSHEVDRFVAPFRIEAGLEPKALPYPNWESTGLGGHSGGHYLTALAQLWAETGDPETKRRLDDMVAELALCQREHGDGYVGGVPGGRALWDDVAAGVLDVEPFSLNRKWVPWYNLHKTFAGLRDAWLVGGNAQAREVLVGLADWCRRLLSGLSDAQVQEMLRAEHGGMNEVVADVYAITGDSDYLALAERFSHRVTLDPLLRHEDHLTGLHANTQIPKVVGFARIAELGGDASWGNAARFFWETVVEKRSVAIGGNSIREHFNPVDDFAPLAESREGPETCNTYNMLRLTELLFREEPAARYADYYERALFNHILSSIHPDHGGLVYFTPLRPRHYRVYSQPGTCFWCCVGSGMESHSKYGHFIFAHSESELYVNLFIASELTWPERGLVLRQETSFPDESATTLALSLEEPQRFALQVRHPGWVAQGELGVRVNGTPWPVDSSPASYLSIAREWRDGDRVEVTLPMRTSVETFPDGSRFAAVVHGPIVLAAVTGEDALDGLVADDGRFSHIAPGPYLPLDEAPALVGELESLADHVRPVPGKPLTFSAPEIIEPEARRDLELVPFFRVHDARYVMYWPVATPDEYEEARAALAAKEAGRLALAARTVDQVAPGEQQPEVEHDLRSEASTTGVYLGRRWREATSWFSYDLQSVPGEALELQVTYYGGDRGRSFDILVDGQPVAAVELGGEDRDRFVDATYEIPSGVTDADDDGVLTVRFAAREGSRTAAVYGLRLLRRGPPE